MKWLTSTRTAPWLMTAGIVVLWQAICSIFAVDEFIFPSPIQVYHALIEYAEPIGLYSLQTLLTNLGIGYLMMSASSPNRMALVFAGLVVVSVLATLMYVVFAWLAMRITGWAHRRGRRRQRS